MSNAWDATHDEASSVGVAIAVAVLISAAWALVLCLRALWIAWRHFDQGQDSVGVATFEALALLAALWWASTQIPIYDVAPDVRSGLIAS